MLNVGDVVSNGANKKEWIIARGEKVIVCGDFNTHSKNDKAYLSHQNWKPIGRCSI